MEENMININENFLNLQDSYLFSTIAKKVAEFQKNNPDKKVIKLGIGDVTRPIVPAVLDAMHKAVDELGKGETFRGYGPEQGYEFLREKIVQNDYAKRGVTILPDEIFVSDGAKCDCGNIGDILGIDNTVAITDPVYPVYLDTNVMAGRSGNYNTESGVYENIIYIPATAENNFIPQFPKKVPDMIYLCFPNNPTGTTLSKDELKKWVDYAKENKSLILFDSAYEAFICDPELPRSIYAIEGAKRCAIEFCSLSKTAGFTGTRCGYTVVPRELVFLGADGREMSLHAMWNRRQSTKFNGTSYIVQKGAEAVFSPEGIRQCQENIHYYQQNARRIADTLTDKNIRFFGGIHSPYIWFECPQNMDSWDFFDYLLNHAQIVGTPGAGFGENGRNYFRLTAFGSHENTIEAMERFRELF